MKPPGRIVTAHDRVRIAAAACVAPETVAKAYRSEPIRSTVAARILDAVRELGLPRPEIVVAP